MSVSSAGSSTDFPADSSSGVIMRKRETRTVMRNVVRQIGRNDRKQQGYEVVRHLSVHMLWRESSYVCSYIPMKHEVDVRPLLKLALAQGKRILVPLPDVYPHTMQYVDRVDEYTYYANNGVYRSIPVPKHASAQKIPLPQFFEKSDCCIILVPGLAFTRNGDRLGQGSGFYDALLAKARIYPHIFTIGVCTEAQIEDDIPHEAHDVPMQYVMTERGIYDTKARSFFIK